MSLQMSSPFSHPICAAYRLISDNECILSDNSSGNIDKFY